MIVRLNDAGTEVQVLSQNHKDTMDLASILYLLGEGDCKLQFRHPRGELDKPMIRFIKVEHAL
jgi:hypothetical protein